jgi:hypothetical protein
MAWPSANMKLVPVMRKIMSNASVQASWLFFRVFFQRFSYRNGSAKSTSNSPLEIKGRWLLIRPLFLPSATRVDGSHFHALNGTPHCAD